MEFYEKLVRDCDEYIRAGQDQKAERALADLEIPKIPRKWRLPLATLCRRVALVSTGLKILSPIVSPSNKTFGATPNETAEYAALLQKFGAVEDALRIFKEVDVSKAPEALMHRAVCHFSRW